MSETLPEDVQNDALFLRQRHGEQFEALNRITGSAVDILAVRALSRNARLRDIKADAELVTHLTDECKAYTAGPLTAEDALYDWNSKRAPLLPGAVMVEAHLDEAPAYTASNRYIPDILSY